MHSMHALIFLIPQLLCCSWPIHTIFLIQFLRYCLYASNRSIIGGIESNWCYYCSFNHSINNLFVLNPKKKQKQVKYSENKQKNQKKPQKIHTHCIASRYCFHNKRQAPWIDEIYFF